MITINRALLCMMFLSICTVSVSSQSIDRGPINKYEIDALKGKEVIGSSLIYGANEITEERTRNFKKYSLSENRYRVVGSVAPIHYRYDPFDRSESYKDIVLRLNQTPKKSWDWEMMNAGYQIRIWQEWEDLKYAAQFQRAEQWISMAPYELYYENDAGERQVVGRPVDASPELSLSKDAITWPNIFGKGLHFRYVLGADRFYKVVIIDSQSVLPVPTIDSAGIKLTVEMKMAWASDLQNSAGLEKHVSHDKFSANRGEVVLQERLNPGKCNFKDSLQRDVFWMQKPRAWDSAEFDTNSIEVANRLQITEEGIASHYSVSTSDLKQVIFPVYIDADITEQVSSNLDDVTCRSGNDELSTTDRLSAGDDNGSNYDFRAGIRFSGVTVPKDANITSANLKLYADVTEGPIPDTIIKGEASDNPGQITSVSDYNNRTTRPYTTSGTWVSWDDLSSWTNNSWQTSPDISAIVQEIVNRTYWASNNAMIIYWQDDTGIGYQEYSRIFAKSRDQSTANAPQLYIEYNTQGSPTPIPTSIPTSIPTPIPTGIGANTAHLLIQSGGDTDGSQSFSDTSSLGSTHTITQPQTSNVHHETGQITHKFGTSSIYFTGSTGEYLEVSDSDDLDFGSSDFTVDFWVYYSPSSANHCFVISNIPGDLPFGSGGGSFWVEIDTGRVPRVRVYDSNGSEFNTSGSNSSIAEDTWNHIAVTKSGSSLRYFLNGVHQEDRHGFESDSCAFEWNHAGGFGWRRSSEYELHDFQRVYRGVPGC